MLEKWRIELSSDLQAEANYCALNINVLESMLEWVRVVDLDGNILFMNKSMEEDTGVRALEYRCSFDHDIASDKALIPRSISRSTFISGQPCKQEVYFQDREYSVNSSPINNEEGRVIAAVEVFRDITEDAAIRRELSRTNMRMKEDIDFAKTIQAQLLPGKERYNNVDIDFYYRPSEDLSGDMFGVSKIDDDKVGIYICDVVGHGVSASLLTMFVKQNISSLMDEGYGIYPGLLLNKLKDRFAELDLESSIYATVFYGYYSQSSSSFVCANAGHNCMPILAGEVGLSLVEAKGLPISDLFLGIDYQEQEIRVVAGDKLIFYTDGFTEVKNHKNEEFGRDRLHAIVDQGGDIIARLVEAVEDFAWGEPDDDMALLMTCIE